MSGKGARIHAGQAGPDPVSGLRPQRKSYADGRLMGLTQVEAHRRAYPSSKAADATRRKEAQDIERDAKVQAYMARERQRAAERLGITVERVLAEYMAIAFADSGDASSWGPGGVTLKDSSTLTEAQRRAIAKVAETADRLGRIHVSVEHHDKVRALDALAKHLGMFVERKEISGPGGGPIPVREVIVEMAEGEAE